MRVCIAIARPISLWPKAIVSSCAAPHTTCGCCIRRTTIISRCFGESRTGARRRKGCARETSDVARESSVMLRLLSIRNFAVVESLDAEFGAGFTVLTGETGAGKSILLDALSLLLGDRFEARQLRPDAKRAEISAEFDLSDAPATRSWLLENDLGDAESLLLRRVLEAQGRSRAWINGSPATLAQLEAVGEQLIDVHGQHAHQSLVRPNTQRALLDAFGGFSTLTSEVALAWREWRFAVIRLQKGTRDAAAKGTERDVLAARHASSWHWAQRPRNGPSSARRSRASRTPRP